MLNTQFLKGEYDAVVVGAGHAGCEAALALARTGFKTALLTLNLDSIAFMACNPSIGGTAKGHLVREVDALGGEMGKVADKTMLHQFGGKGKWYTYRGGPDRYEASLAAQQLVTSPSIDRAIAKDGNWAITHKLF